MIGVLKGTTRPLHQLLLGQHARLQSSDGCINPGILLLGPTVGEQKGSDPLALLTTVFHRFYGARRVLYVVETTFLTKFEPTLSAILFKLNKLPKLLTHSQGPVSSLE